MKRAFDNLPKSANTHPPRAFRAVAYHAVLWAVDGCEVHIRFPGGDPAALMRLRGMHISSTRFYG